MSENVESEGEISSVSSTNPNYQRAENIQAASCRVALYVAYSMSSYITYDHYSCDKIYDRKTLNHIITWLPRTTATSEAIQS